MAWRPLGWEPLWFSEIASFPCALLSHYYDVPNLGDMNEIKDAERADLIMAGTPCQSFSIAGLRKGMDDPRGNLTLVFLGLVEKLRPRWVVLENVPGILSSWTDEEEGKNGERWQSNDFDTFLCGLSEIGYRWAWRILDAQYFGVPQRRRRVFVVGYLGDWRRAAAVLFERSCLSGHPPPSREKREAVAGSLGGGACERGWNDDFDRSGAFIPETSMIAAPLTGNQYGDHESRESLLVPEVAKALNAHGGPSRRLDAESETFITHSLRSDGFDASEDETGRGTPIIAFDSKRGGGEGEIALTLRSMSGKKPNAGGQVAVVMVPSMSVRRLTPLECERLMGLPDNYTRIPYRGKPAEECPDGPRYRALGNSIVVSAMQWIGRRIEAVERIEA